MKTKLYLSIFLTLVAGNVTIGQTPGCNDPLATNYNPLATQNNGSCVYNPATIYPVDTWELPDVVDESSGLIIWNDKIITHNDDTDTNLYAFDTADISAYDVIPLEGVVNVDWEEISQDEEYIYIGDFGNNANGNRTDLKILKISKESLLTQSPQIETIHFTYSLQSDFAPQGGNNTDFDCEAFIVTSDSIYLFTKEWNSENTSVYSLPKQPGTYVAQFRDRYNVQGLITGSTYLQDKRLVVLSAYTRTLQPFLFLLYDFQGADFLGGNKRRVPVNLPFHQVEGITTEDGINYFISNELFSYSLVTTKQKLHLLDLSSLLGSYLDGLLASMPRSELRNILIYPNPATRSIIIEIDDYVPGESFKLIDMNGNEVRNGRVYSRHTFVGIEGLNPGIYTVLLENPRQFNSKIVIR